MKALILGTNAGQADIISYLKQKGWEVHACGYRQEGPGCDLADEFHLADTLDVGAVKELTKDIKPDIIYSVSSDSAIKTVTKVAEALGLPHFLNSELIDLFDHKEKLRLFLNDNEISKVGFMTLADFNAVICAVLLLLLIWAMDYLFSLCFKKSDLGISEKKRYIFMAYVGACISGFIIASRDASKLALEIPNITISVLIGAYVPFTLLLEDGKKGKVELQSMKEEWEEKYKKTFRERKAKDILSVLLFAMVYGVLLGVALSPAQNIINDITSGIGMGMATVVVAFVGLVEVKNRLTKRKNKREDADQEKSGTE